MPADKPPFAITEEWPTPIVRDFRVFLDQVAQPTAYLSPAKRTLDRATLYAANAKMLTFQTEAHPRMDQEYYALLNLFQRICISARLHVPGVERKKLRMVPTESLARFQALNPAERYLALLEAVWVDCDWEELRTKHSWTHAFALDRLAALLAHAPAGKEIRREGRSAAPRSQRLMAVFQAPDAVRILSFFGFLACTPAPEATSTAYYKGAFDIASFTLSPFGKEFLNVLTAERPYAQWNEPLLEEAGGEPFSPFGVWPEDEEEPEEDSNGGAELPAEEGQEAPREPFHRAFLPLLPEGAVSQGLPRIEQELRDQTFVFRVRLSRARHGSVPFSRTISLSSEHTLEDLHLAIQRATRFDNDHLYAFYMDGKRYSRNAYSDPRGGEGPFADEIALGLLDLYPRQRILYLFDFGDCWQFDVELLEVRDEHHKGRPKVIEEKGKNPKQYSGW